MPLELLFAAFQLQISHIIHNQCSLPDKWTAEHKGADKLNSTHPLGGQSWQKVSRMSETTANQSHPPPLG